jgi:carbamoyltransferase
MAGGVALNCVANSHLLNQGIVDNIFIQPAANDAGTALGAALLVWTQKMGQERAEMQEHAYWGPSFEEDDLVQALENEELIYEKVEDIEEFVASRLAQGDVVGWFQGAMEFGPRALGNRSLLADPRNPAMRDILNVKVKHREIFRPFAPSVLEEEAKVWFDLDPGQMPYEYMLMTAAIRPECIPFIPAVTHEDGTARIHLVKQHVNPRYHKLISSFHSLTGVPLLLNTSFNDDEPIVCSPADAIETFKKTSIDYLVLGDFVVERCRQAGLAHVAQPMERELS